MTDAELAILSLLAEGPSYDDDLYSTIEKRGLRRWTAIGTSSMYYVLEKLENQGLVERVSEDKGRRLHRISAAGNGILQTAVVDLLGTPHAPDRNFELGLANLHVLKPSQVRTALHNRRQDIAIRVSRITEERRTLGANFAIDALFAHHIQMLESELVWLDQFVAAWEEQAPTEVEPIIIPSIAPRIKQVVLPQDPDSVHKQPTLNPSSRPTQSASDTPHSVERPSED